MTAIPSAIRQPDSAVPRRSPRILVFVVLGLTLAVGGCTSAAQNDPVTVTKVVKAPSRSSQPAGTPRPASTTRAVNTASQGTGGDPGSTGPTAPPVETSDARTPAATSTARTREPTSSGAGTPTANAPDASPDTPGPEGGRDCATDAQYVDEDPTGLRSDVIAGWRAIEKSANADGVIVCLNDGKRSRAQQQAQYDQYEQQYGKEVADQLVLPPAKSAHVIGNAIDVQPQAAYQWLQATKGDLGFCRIYDNEPWHFEYDVTYFEQGCPARLPKPQR